MPAASRPNCATRCFAAAAFRTGTTASTGSTAACRQKQEAGGIMFDHGKLRGFGRAPLIAATALAVAACATNPFAPSEPPPAAPPLPPVPGVAPGSTQDF